MGKQKKYTMVVREGRKIKSARKRFMVGSSWKGR